MRKLIAQSMDSMRAGATLADQVSQVVASGVQSMQGVAADISRIAVSTQSGAEVAEVNLAMGRVSEATQQNAALVEQSSAAAQQLRAQAQSLSELIRKFVLPQQAHPQARADLEADLATSPALAAPREARAWT